ncbi:TolC family protein [Thauera sinica]|uniref:TolC family protein n=1 Tax=Thauera sinica TaxID=2665146 RepID=A0ABW1AL01_9RHOO
MHGNSINALCAVAIAMAAGVPAWAQPPGAAAPVSLKDAFDLAWERQPEARSAAARRDAAQAARAVAASWSAEAPALELSAKSDRPGSNDGSREYEVGLAIPLWLPGERPRAGALADAEAKALESRFLAARLSLAEAVRDAWWACHRAASELALAQDRLVNTRQLAADVARRVKAGELSRADQHQAEGAVARAEAAQAEALGARNAALAALQGVVGHAGLTPGAGEAGPEPMPEEVPDAMPPSGHPAIDELSDRASVARRAAELAAVQDRASPELILAATRERGRSGEDFGQSFTVGIRIPFGGGARAQARQAVARAEALDTEAQAEVERARVAAGIESARARMRATQAQAEAADRRARLARETRSFFDKSFQLGESDLPARLRVELEAAEAERDLARARIDAAAAVSALRQSLGLLP